MCLSSFTLSLSSSAADAESDEVVFDDYGAYQEYLYFDFKPGDIVLYEPYVDERGNVWDNSPAFYPSAAEPNYPDFNLNNLDLDSIPENIMDVIRSDNCGLLIRVWDTTYRIFVTRDCNFFYYIDQETDSAGNFVVSERKTPFVGICTTNYAYTGCDPVCYFADYNYDGSIRSSSWSELSMLNFPSPYNSTRIGIRVFAWPFTTTASDNYYLGNWSNMKGETGSSKRFMTVAGDGSTSTMLYCVQFSSVPSTNESTLYLSDKISFPTYESQELETSKNILDRIKELPETLSNFFTTLKNYLLYFSSEPVERTESAFSNLLDSVVTNLQLYIDEIDNYVNNYLPDTRDNVIEYIEVGTVVIDDFLSGVPIISYLLLFAIAIIFVKKAVGK